MPLVKHHEELSMKGLGPSGFATVSNEAACHPSGFRPEGSTLSMRQGPPALGDARIRHLSLVSLLWGPVATDKPSRGNRGNKLLHHGWCSLSQKLPQSPHSPKG